MLHEINFFSKALDSSVSFAGPFKNTSLYAASKQLIEKLPLNLEYSVEAFTKFYLKKYDGEKQPKVRKCK
jgi:hypothetical protein